MPITAAQEHREEQRARLIAYYLPQFHPVPENDAWWGPGFTEWTNVAKARPLFPGHCQPLVPSDLGFYDLRLPETRQAQADLARAHGIEGFCYWHYWFAGKRLLERPFNEVLASGTPDFPFCLGWANESWTGVWHGAADTILMAQEYPGPADEEAHFRALLPAFRDPRYIRVQGRPLFLVYNPHQLPEPRRFMDHWQELAVREGLPGIYFAGERRWLEHDPLALGFHALVPHSPGLVFNLMLAARPAWRRHLTALWNHYARRPTILDYGDYVRTAPHLWDGPGTIFPSVLPNWDNTPRSGSRGFVLQGATAELFGEHLRQAMARVASQDAQERVIFIKSWNEWAEGNHLEPDTRNGCALLEACRREVAP